MVVHPGNGNYTGTLVNALAYYFRDDPTYDANDPNVGLVHRIDKDTSGLLVVAKRPEAKTALGKQFFEKTSERSYRALVWGAFKESEGRIEGNIGRDPRDRTRMSVFPPDSDEGKNAITHYRVLETFAFVSYIECRLETGRTHQIRAHMKSINHPLFGDEKYGGSEILRGRPSSSYLSLHAICSSSARDKPSMHVHWDLPTPQPENLCASKPRSLETWSNSSRSGEIMLFPFYKYQTYPYPLYIV